MIVLTFTCFGQSMFFDNLNKDIWISDSCCVNDNDKGILKLILSDTQILNYNVGIVSTGFHAFLTREKEKKK